MSADNAIFVWGRGDTWYAEHGFMSTMAEDPNEPVRIFRHGTRKTHPRREAALLAAHDLAKRETVLEYGVVEL